MKRIGIDARLINQTGVGVYTRNLLKHLEKVNPPYEIYVYLREVDKNSIMFANPKFIKRVADYHWHSWSEQTGFLNDLNRDNLDLMHFTYFSHPVLYTRPYVITIHDIIPLTHPTGKASTLSPVLYFFKQFGYQYSLRSGVRKSRAIITPTRTVKNDIIKHVNAGAAEKICITSEGVNEVLITTKESADLKKNIKGPFFLYVGNFYPHKNVESLIRAFHQLDTDHKLILVGPKDYFAQRTHALVKELKMNNVHFLHNSSMEDLVYCYRHAEALIHPSFTEGFGLPLLEASYFGCPIIASDIPVFNEILGDSYTRFDPQNVDDLADKIKTFMSGKKPLPKLLTKEHIERTFSFKKMAQQTLDIYKELL